MPTSASRRVNAHDMNERVKSMERYHPCRNGQVTAEGLQSYREERTPVRSLPEVVRRTA